jgi:hypothetical protein
MSTKAVRSKVAPWGPDRGLHEDLAGVLVPENEGKYDVER